MWWSFELSGWKWWVWVFAMGGENPVTLVCYNAVIVIWMWDDDRMILSPQRVQNSDSLNKRYALLMFEKCNLNLYCMIV